MLPPTDVAKNVNALADWYGSHGSDFHGARYLDGDKTDWTAAALWADMTVTGDLPTQFKFKLNTSTVGSPKLDLVPGDKFAVISTLKPVGWGGDGTAIVDALPSGSKGTAIKGTNSVMTISQWYGGN